MQVDFIDEVFICLSCLSAACGKSLNYNNKIKSDFCMSKAFTSLSVKPVLNWVNFCFVNLVGVFVEPEKSLANIVGS